MFTCDQKLGRLVQYVTQFSYNESMIVMIKINELVVLMIRAQQASLPVMMKISWKLTIFNLSVVMEIYR